MKNDGPALLPKLEQAYPAKLE
jgi:hypothetical protein